MNGLIMRAKGRLYDLQEAGDISGTTKTCDAAAPLSGHRLSSTFVCRRGREGIVRSCRTTGWVCNRGTICYREQAAVQAQLVSGT
jgi:hypothetical protein